MSRRKQEQGTAKQSHSKETQMDHRARLRSLRACILTVAMASLLLAGSAAPAAADFGFESVALDLARDDTTPLTPNDGVPATQAGSHPSSVTTSFGLNYVDNGLFDSYPDEEPRNTTVDMPAGFIGDATVMPRCESIGFLTRLANSAPDCPNATAVGAQLARIVTPVSTAGSAVFNLEPPPGVPVRLGFYVLGVPIIVDVAIKTSPPYNAVATLTNTSQAVAVFGATVELWGDPTDPVHDPVRGQCINHGAVSFFVEEWKSVGDCPTERLTRPFLTLPRSCQGPLAADFTASSWQTPDRFVSATAVTDNGGEPPVPQGLTGCEKVGFAPVVEASPTTELAESGSGFEFSLSFSDGGLTSLNGIAGSDAKKAEVTLPEGMTINPSVGEGLGVCSPDDLDRETLDSGPGEGCPDASKLGTLRLETPVVDEDVEGSVYLAQQDDPTTPEPGAENPFDSLIALYLVMRNTNLGALVKLPMKVEPHPLTGRLVATLDNAPQVPFSRFVFRFREGVRAALITPDACGTYTTVAKFWPWAELDNPRTVTSSFEITKGVDGGACPPGGVPPFSPHFEAGSINNNAGSFSPFDMRLIRNDGEQNMTKFSSILPPGVLGSLAGVAKCPDVAVPIAKSKTGRQEQAAPSCPAGSLIGHTLAGAGVGSALTYVGGKIYLAGAYKGAPLSVISITPAVAGPFDAGTVVIRLGLDLDPKTAEVSVDGAASDPIPHILKGIVLKVRDLRVSVNRPNFTLNPTSCDESSAKAQLFGSFLDVLNPADDVPVNLATRYQAANCLNLGFKPKLGLRLKGGTRRGGHPGLRAVYTPKRGDANIEGLVVRLPRSAFLDQAHIRTICTRVQYAAQACPKAARYGYIRAWTPLLDTPLQGPVWLRSSNHKLPDLVFDLKGLVDIEVAVRIDSARGGIRATLVNAPDAPLSRVVLNMQGGKKGLIINSRNLCTRKSRANVRATGQNGKLDTKNPVMRPQCKKRKAKRSSHGRSARGSVASASAVG